MPITLLKFLAEFGRERTMLQLVLMSCTCHHHGRGWLQWSWESSMPSQGCMGINGTYLSLQQIVVLSFYTWIKLSGGVGAGRDRSRTWDEQRDIWKTNPLEDFFSKCVKYNTGGLTWHHKGTCWRSTLRHWSSCSHHDPILHQTWDMHHSCSLSSQCRPCQFRCPPNGTDGWSWWCIFSRLSLQSVLSFWLNVGVQMSVFGLQSIVHVIPLPLGTREDDPWSIIGTLLKMVTLLVLWQK